MKKVSFLLVCALLASVGFAQNIYLKVAGAPSDGPNGSTILAYSQGVSNPVNYSTGGTQTGIPSVSSFNVMKMQSKISLYLLKASLQGQKLSSAELSFYDKDKNLYLRILLEDVYVESLQHSGSQCSSTSSNACGLTESISLNATKVRWDDLKTGTSVSYNRAENSVQ